MSSERSSVSRRDFLATGTAAVAGAAVMANPALAAAAKRPKKRVALVGTGIRGNSMWGRSVAREYRDHVEEGIPG